MGFVTISALILLVTAGCWAQGSFLKARVVLSGSSPVMGVLNLTEVEDGVVIVGRLSGLTPGNHGFHVHQFGDIFTNGCDSTGPHFNPKMVVHGAPDDEDTRRHAGDFGNILADDTGLVLVNMTDRHISLGRQNSILGRAFVVHEKEDDLGRGNNDGSTKTGNAGARLACGIVALVP